MKDKAWLMFGELHGAISKYGHYRTSCDVTIKSLNIMVFGRILMCKDVYEMAKG